MNRREAFETVRDKKWLYKIVDSRGNGSVVFLGESGEGFGFLIISFEEDGNICFRSRVGFEPGEFKKWSFDEETQEIVFMDQDDNATLRASVPQSGEYDTQIIKVHERNAFFDWYPYTDIEEVDEHLIGGKQMIFAPYQISKKMDLPNLGRLGYSTHLIRNTETLRSVYNDIFNYIIEHATLKQIVITNDSINDVTLPQVNKLGLFNDDSGNPSFDYIAGNRELVREFVNVVIIAINDSKIENPGQRIDEKELLHQVLTNKFSNRYEILN